MLSAYTPAIGPVPGKVKKKIKKYRFFPLGPLWEGAPPAGGGGESLTGGVRASGCCKTLFESIRPAPLRVPRFFGPVFACKRRGYAQAPGRKMKCRPADFVQNVDKKRRACYNKGAKQAACTRTGALTPCVSVVFADVSYPRRGN